jgi:tol-pal system protein YbgF
MYVMPSWRAAALAALMLASVGAQAALFGDDEARLAILELRKRVDAQVQASETIERRLTDENTQLRRSLLDLQNQIETQRAELAKARGQNEQILRDMAEMQRRNASVTQAFDERLRLVEPQKVASDGKEFMAAAAEKRDFEAALGFFRAGDFAAAQTGLLDFSKHYPKSGYFASVLFWLGNAQYATRDYKEAIANFRSMLAQAPDHPRAAEAVLSIANCQIELKDTRVARRTLEDLIRQYPQSEAAQAAKDRLAKLH